VLQRDSERVHNGTVAPFVGGLYKLCENSGTAKFQFFCRKKTVLQAAYLSLCSSCSLLFQLAEFFGADLTIVLLLNVSVFEIFFTQLCI